MDVNADSSLPLRRPHPARWHLDASESTHEQHTFKIVSQAPSTSHLQYPMESLPVSTGKASVQDIPFLPPIAISMIFQHLDSSSGLNLAQTCRAHAHEFAQQREDFISKSVTSVTPVLSLDEATDLGYGTYGNKSPVPYGTGLNPFSITAWWASSNAIYRIYMLAQERPELLRQIWTQAWPANLWDELMVNGPGSRGHSRRNFGDCDIRVRILLESKDRLLVPWKWLHGPFTRSAYDALDHVLAQNAWTRVVVSLHRPAAAGKHQEVMLTHFIHREEEQFEWEFTTYSQQSHYAYTTASYRTLPDEQQWVAVTGSWCVGDKLPAADVPLWRAQQGCTMRLNCLAEGDKLYNERSTCWDRLYVEGSMSDSASVDSRSTTDLDCLDQPEVVDANASSLG